MIVDFLHNSLTYNHPLWLFHDPFLPNHTFIDYFIMVFIYIPTVLIFIGKYPKAISKQVLWILLWVALYSFIEYVHYGLNLISYHNGWSYFYSIQILFAQFTILKIHHSRPLLAWVLTIMVTGFHWVSFDLPIEKIK
jgi:hypothetical protein